MTTVVLVGAGATLAEALPRRPARNRLPPLDATFFELCRLASLPGRDEVSRYMSEAFGFDPMSGGYRMEEVFNYIYSEAFSESPSQQCLSAYWSLIRMYASAIARTTNSLSGTSHCGVGAILRSLWKRGVTDLVFVTFNQDLLIEKALNAAQATRRYRNVPWNIRTCYGLDFVDFHTMTSRPRPFRIGPVADNSIQVLKLHGSLNWNFNVRSGTDPRNSIRTPKGKLHCLNEQWVRANLKSPVRKRMIDVVPLVVPPIYEKASRYQSVVAPVWTAARTALEQCERLVVFGYSFPDADFAARTMLRGALHKNNKLDCVDVIDPSSVTLGRIVDLAGKSKARHFRDAPSFCGTV